MAFDVTDEGNIRRRATGIYCDSGDVREMERELKGLRHILDAERASVEGHNEPCYYCHKPCNRVAANPNLWPIPLCHADDPGVVKWHHIGCVSERLAQLASAQQQLEDADYMGNLLSIIHGDGGHYRAAHGNKKATDDAIEIVSKMKVELDAAQQDKERLLREIHKCRGDLQNPDPVPR